MNVVAYCRVSTDEQDQLNSLKTQKDFFEEYAKKNSLNLIHIYSDAGISGTKTKNRAAFNQMMSDAESGIFKAVLFKDVSRLARNTADFLGCYRKLQGLGVKMHFLSYNMTNMDTGEFYLTLLAAIAQEESYNTSRRIKFSKHYNAEKGRVPNFIFGYDKTNGEYFDLNVNEREAEIVRKIFAWYTGNGDGTLKISARLNEMGITTKKGCKWTPNAVLRILKNRIYTGKIANGKQEIVNFPDSKRVDKPENEWIVVENKALRIISDETYEKARALIEERASSQSAKHHSNKHLFSTLIKCGECGHSFRRLVTRYKNTYVRWVCSWRNGRGASACENTVSIDEEEIISALRDYFF
ncbi:MAG: recombinase family protein [Clostridia bacterium]|nr:recombinase family protein [Clostridia bacterium]